MDNWEKCKKYHHQVKEGLEGGSREYRLRCLTSIHGKVMKQLILEAISRQIKHMKIVRSSLHDFTKRKSCLSSLINLYDSMTGLVDEGRAVVFVCLDFIVSIDSVSHEILLAKLRMPGWMSRAGDGFRTLQMARPESGDRQHKVQLEASDQQYPQGPFVSSPV